MIKISIYKSYKPLQFGGAPVNPILQAQEKLPGEFVQVAETVVPHPPLSVAHSSISVNINTNIFDIKNISCLSIYIK